MKYRLINFAKNFFILICIASSFFIIAYTEGVDSALKLLIELTIFLGSTLAVLIVGVTCLNICIDESPFKKIKRYFDRRKADKVILNILDSRQHIADLMLQNKLYMESTVENVNISEEKKMDCIDKYLTRKNSLENILLDLNKLLEFTRAIKVNDVEYDNYRAVTIHDMLEDENINLENRVNQLFDYQELKEFIDSVEVKKSHNTD